MAGISRQMAFAFAADTKWKKAFMAIDDTTPILVAGMADMITVTTYDKPSDRVYYMVTERGLHVGQEVRGGGFLRGATRIDHFMPREAIIGIDTDFIEHLQVDARDGSRAVCVSLTLSPS